MAIEKDKSVILFGVPADGKSLTIKLFLEWLTKEFNGGERKKPINPNMTNFHTENEYGIKYNSLNVDEATNTLILFGGYSPESIGGRREERRKNVELGIITESVLYKEYLMLDEVNRTDNETLGRLMGFLAEPYSYDVKEADLKIVLKYRKKERANFLILATMNTGDQGNFRMSNAFKRRWKIIEVKYKTEQIKTILNRIKGYTTDEKTNIGNIYRNLGIDSDNYNAKILPLIEKLVPSISEVIYNVTHKWADEDKIVQFGVGIGHITEVLEDLSLNLTDLFDWGIKKKEADYIKDKDFRNKVVEIVTESFDENILVALADENDLYKMKMLHDQKIDIIRPISTRIANLFMQIGLQLDSDTQDKYIKNTKLPLLVSKIFKF
jgi:hypothetical protein